MSSETIVQTGLFGDTYPVSPDCSECGGIIKSRIYYNPNNKELCKDCFENSNWVICPNCEKTVGCDDLIEMPDGMDWCESCADGDSFECDNCNTRAWNDDRVEVTHRRGRYGYLSTSNLCEDCADRETTSCSDCSNRIFNDDSHTTRGGDTICESCYSDSYITCEDCCEIVHIDDSGSTDYGCYCNDCQPYGDDFHPRGFCNRSGRITDVGSARCYGIELETDKCDGYHVLEASGPWGAKDDGSIDGKEFYSDILSGDDGLKAVKDWADIAEENSWEVTSNCGYHLHLDMRNESDDSLYAIAYAYRATEEVWYAFVERQRRANVYSGPVRWNCVDITNAAAADRSFYSWAGSNSRYNWINVTSYTQHTTIEVRAHQGTCDNEEIINWIKAHTRFADWAATKGLAGVQEALHNLSNVGKFDLIASEAWQDEKLRDYYAGKANEYHNIRF